MGRWQAGEGGSTEYSDGAGDRQSASASGPDRVRPQRRARGARCGRRPRVPYNAPSMSGFVRGGGGWECDGVPLAAVAAEVGTPVYVYSAAVVRERVRRFRAAFGPWPHAVHYALKANSNLAVVEVVRAAGGLVDANSGGEIEVALRAGFAPGDIVFTGVGKTPAEIDRAVELGVQGDQRRIGGRAGADIVRGTAARDDGPRRPPRQSGHRRRQPSPHLDRPEPAQVRGRDRRCAGDRTRCLGPRGTALHRAPHPRGLPDARAGPVAAGGGGGGRPRAGAWPTTA